MKSMEDLLKECCDEKIPTKSIAEETLIDLIDRVDRLEKKLKKLDKKSKRLRVTEDEVLKRGDVVKCHTKSHAFTGIFYGIFEGHYWILDKRCLVPQRIPMTEWSLEKLGKHVDIFKESED